jgi:ribosomal protein S18 acetylase RimI-like enzyme
MASMAKIRPAVVADVPRIVDLWDREGGPTRHAGRHEDATRLLHHDSGALLVAERDGALVGTLIVGWDGWRCHLYRLAVEPTARRTGTARELALAAVDRGARLGAARLDAMVDPDNETAVSFWEAMGFELGADRRWSLPL